MPSLDQALELQRPPTVRFGAGQVRALAEWIAEVGARRCFVVADKINAARLDVLGLQNPALFGDVRPEPDLPNLEAAAAAAKAIDADAVIGFGGGSAMDLAKLVAVLVTSDKGLRDISGPNRAPKRSVKLIQIPTTAGTGSEVGTRALITDPKTMNKIATESVEMLADIAIIDPALTVSVPPTVTAATGVDAMAHCVEAFTSKRSHPIIDDYALRGIQLVGRYLKRALEDGTDIEARAGLALAAFYGGICLGPVNTTAGHALAYPLGTRHKLAHGIANALIFPHVLAANAVAVPEKTALVGQALGFGCEGRQAVFGGAHAFCIGLSLEMGLRSYGIPRDDLPACAYEAHQIRRLLDFNPVELSEANILDIYEAAY
jgi:alcohol dehydrogenase class IV